MLFVFAVSRDKEANPRPRDDDSVKYFGDSVKAEFCT